MGLYLIGVFIIGLVIYRANKQALPCYWIILNTLLLPVVSFLDGVMDIRDTMIAEGKQSAVLNLLLILLLLLEFKSTVRRIHKFNAVLISLLLLVITFLLWSIYHGSRDTLMESLLSQRNYVTLMLLPLYVYVVGVSTRLAKFLCLFILLCELILATFTHYTGYHLYLFQYLPGQGLGFEDEFSSGTFKSYTLLSSFLVVIQAIISSEYLILRKISSRFFLGVTIITGLVIMMLGSRLGMFCFFIDLILPALLNYNYNKLFLLSISVLGIIVMVTAFSLSSMLSTNDAENGFERNLIGIAEKFNTKSVNYGKTTDSMSSDLFNDYFNFDPLGQGLTANQDVEHAYGDENYAVDARLAFILVEYGWLYFIFVLSFFISFYRAYTKPLAKSFKHCVFVITTILVLQSVTNDGFYDKALFGIWGIYAYYCLQSQIEQNRKRTLI